MAMFYMMIGIPGSGKSTWARTLIEEQRKNADHKIVCVCPDQIREELTGDAANQSANAAVWELTYQLVKQNLEDDISVLVDATFVKTRDRRKMLAHAKACGPIQTIAYLCNPPLEIAKQRNANRNRVVPEHVLDRMYDQLSMKDLINDGFDTIIDVEEFNEQTKAIMDCI